VKFVLLNGRTPYPQTFCTLRRANPWRGRAGSRGRRIKNSTMSCRHLGCDWRRRSVTLAPKA
jgi:hypothetical protein